MSAEAPGGDGGVVGASAGAEIRWLGGRIWGVSDGIVGSLSPRIGSESELQTVQLHGFPEVIENTEPDYEGLPQGASTSTHMLAGAVAGIMEHCLMFPIDCVKVKCGLCLAMFRHSLGALFLRAFSWWLTRSWLL